MTRHPPYTREASQFHHSCAIVAANLSDRTHRRSAASPRVARVACLSTRTTSRARGSKRELFFDRMTRQYTCTHEPCELIDFDDESRAGARHSRQNQPNSHLAGIERVGFERAWRAIRTVARRARDARALQTSRTSHRARRPLADVASARRGVR